MLLAHFLDYFLLRNLMLNPLVGMEPNSLSTVNVRMTNRWQVVPIFIQNWFIDVKLKIRLILLAIKSV